MQYNHDSFIPHITPEWITWVLYQTGVLRNATVTQIDMERISGEVSFNAQLMRLSLTYNFVEATAPHTLILKLPTTDTTLQANATVFRPGSKEHWFYQRIAPSTRLHVARCYYSAVDATTRESVLVLEDLVSAQRINQVTGVAADAAQLALQSVAGLHSGWWERQSATEIQELQSITDSSGAAEALVEKLYAQAWPQFLQSGIVTVPTDVKRFGERLVGRITETEQLLTSSPQTLIHGDFRLDNLLFDLQKEPPCCWLLDWEDVAFGCGVCDLAWFLGGCLQLQASTHEEDLLRFYHHTLLDKGVLDYSWLQCLHDYRYAMISSFVQGVLSSMVDENASDYDCRFAHAVASRFIAACQRLRLGELMKGTQ
jgi:hypothetical protein